MYVHMKGTEKPLSLRPDAAVHEDKTGPNASPETIFRNEPAPVYF